MLDRRTGGYDTLVKEYIHFIYNFDSTTVQTNYFSPLHQNNVDTYLEETNIKYSTYAQSKLDKAEEKLLKNIPEDEIVPISYLVFAYGKIGNLEQKLAHFGTEKALDVKPNPKVKFYEQNLITSELFSESTYTDLHMDPAISTSVTSNCNAMLFTLDKIKTTDPKNWKRMYELFEIVACTLNKYGVPRHNAKYRYEWDQMKDKPYYLPPWTNSAIELIACVTDHHTYMVAKELILASFVDRGNLAKMVSSPMTVLTAVLPIRGTFITNENLELEYSDRSVDAIISDEMHEDLEKSIQDLYDQGLEYIPSFYYSWFKNPDPLTFPNVALIYSMSFHIGYRKQALVDAADEQISITYSDDVDEGMYDEYSERLERYVYETLEPYVRKKDKRLIYSELSALLSMSSASNGVMKTIQFGSKTIRTTKKNMQVMDDIYTGKYSAELPTVDENNPIPLGRRDVPARRTRLIFMLPYPYYIAQHSVAELMLVRAKKTREFSELYSQANQVLAYGDMNRFLGPDSILCFTDVSQWDASRHNTGVLRNSLKRATLRLIALTDDKDIKKTLERYMDSQMKLLNSYVYIDGKAIQYGATASGEKQTKLMNSNSNLALIQTIISHLESEYTFKVMIIRVDGDDNAFVVKFNRNITRPMLSEFTRKIRALYSRMDIRVKALASLTGAEMSKRFISGGRLYFRAGLSLLNREKRNQDSAYDSAAVLYANYITNALRGLHMNRTFILTKLCQMTSQKITGTLRLFPLQSVLTMNSAFKVFDIDDFIIQYPTSVIDIQLQQRLASIRGESQTSDVIVRSKQFSNYVQFLSKALLREEHEKVAKGLAKTEEAKLNSFSPVAIEKRQSQFRLMIKFLQDPSGFSPVKVVTINDVLKYIYDRITLKRLFKPTRMSTTMPLLPENVKRCLGFFGLRTHDFDLHGSTSNISKMIKEYSVYSPSVEELYDIVNSPPDEIGQYLSAFGVPISDQNIYLSAQLYKQDRFKILQSYIYALLSVNYGMNQLVDIHSVEFDNLVLLSKYNKTPTAVFMINLACRLKIINEFMKTGFVHSCSGTFYKTDYLHIWRMLWNVKMINSPYTKASIFDD
ncbi:VP1 [Rotavirus K]|nr:VP1 [Rotavirus K]